jgi:hypothetical protein
LCGSEYRNLAARESASYSAVQIKAGRKRFKYFQSDILLFSGSVKLSLSIREEHRSRILGNRALKRIPELQQRK